MMLGSYTGPAVAAKIIKPTWCLLSLREREFLVSTGERALERFSSADPPRNDTYASPQERRRKQMSKLYRSDGLSILARYTSDAAISIASSALPLKSTATGQARDNQVRVQSSEDGRTLIAIAGNQTSCNRSCSDARNGK
jgi:hypothetical protein